MKHNNKKIKEILKENQLDMEYHHVVPAKNASKAMKQYAEEMVLKEQTRIYDECLEISDDAGHIHINQLLNIIQGHKEEKIQWTNNIIEQTLKEIPKN